MEKDEAARVAATASAAAASAPAESAPAVKATRAVKQPPIKPRGDVARTMPKARKRSV